MEYFHLNFYFSQEWHRAQTGTLMVKLGKNFNKTYYQPNQQVIKQNKNEIKTIFGITFFFDL